MIEIPLKISLQNILRVTRYSLYNEYFAVLKNPWKSCLISSASAFTRTGWLFTSFFPTAASVAGRPFRYLTEIRSRRNNPFYLKASTFLASDRLILSKTGQKLWGSSTSIAPIFMNWHITLSAIFQLIFIQFFFLQIRISKTLLYESAFFMPNRKNKVEWI